VLRAVTCNKGRSARCRDELHLTRRLGVAESERERS